MKRTRDQVPDWREDRALDHILLLKSKGLSAREIGRIFGVTKNAVLKRIQTARRKSGHLSLSSFASHLGRDASGACSDGSSTVNAKKTPVWKQVQRRDPDRGFVLDIRNLPDTSGCQWPLWSDEERPTFRYCGKPVERGRWPHVYCSDCLDKAFSRSMHKYKNN